MKQRNHLIFIIGFLGILLRFLLWWVVPADVWYDDHFEPAMLLLRDGKLPAPNLCFECFQPPFFYGLSALIAKALSVFTDNDQIIRKSLQGLTWLFGAGTIPLVWQVLKQFDFQQWVKLSLFAVFCFLPRHIFMSVTHSNDSALYFFVTATVWATLVWRKQTQANWWPLLVATLGGMAILTKSTAVVLFPFFAVFIFTQLSKKSMGWKIRQLVVVAGIPFICFVGHLWWKSQYIGNPFQMNLEIFQLDIPQRPGVRNPVSFEIWEYWEMPMVRQENTESLFSTLFMQFWFESEPKISWKWFKDETFCFNYQVYINYRNAAERPDWSKIPHHYLIYGRTGLVVGLIITVVFIYGLLRFLYKTIKEKNFKTLGWSLLALMLLNVAGIITLTGKFPMYSFMKGAFLLTSLPALLYFLGNGFKCLSQAKVSKWILVAPVFVLMIYTSIYCSHFIYTYIYV